MILSMKMSIFSITCMSIIKAINDAIITRNDIIGALFLQYWLHLPEITDTNTKNNDQ